MLIQVILGPFATLWILPWRLAASCLFVTGSVGGLSLGLKYVRAHYIGIPEINISVLSTSMVGMCLFVLLFMTLIQRWEDNFESLPWKSLQHTAKTRLICPFTGESIYWTWQALRHSVCTSIQNLCQHPAPGMPSCEAARKHTEVLCPGDPVTRRCINCETLVSNQAFHRKDILTTFLVGESVLGWPKAHAALKKVLP